jgi:hypothetical protein
VLSSVGLERPDKRVGKVTGSNSVAQPVNAKNFIEKQWVLSSVGLERYPDTVEVTGSNPVAPTCSLASIKLCKAIFFIKSQDLSPFIRLSLPFLYLSIIHNEQSGHLFSQSN